MRRLLVLSVPLAALVFPVGADATIRSFRSPSGNIGCIYYRDPDVKPSVRCDLRNGGNDVAWRVGATGKGKRIRVTDSALDPTAPVLAYGKSRTFGRITCTSRMTGMTCKNTQGHGFTISREKQRVF